MERWQLEARERETNEEDHVGRERTRERRKENKRSESLWAGSEKKIKEIKKFKGKNLI